MSEQVTAHFRTEDGAQHRVSCLKGATMLDAAYAAGVEITATCGARGRCRSCRVQVTEGTLPPPTIQDTVQLGPEAVRERFRLACQTRLIDSVKATVLPPRSETGFQIMTSGRRAADAGGISLDSGVSKKFITANIPTSEHHQSSDHEEILTALGGNVRREVPLDVIRKLPSILRKENGRVTVTLFRDGILDVEVGDTTDKCFGMAFDIGTTSIVGSLLDLSTGEELATVGGLNPQAAYGGDLMSRIAFAQFDDKKLQTLRAKVLNTITDFIKEACQKANVSVQNVYKIVVVGNTCMHHILLGIDVSYVGLAPYAPTIRDALVIPARDLPLKGIPNAVVCTLPIIAGFVGADTIACVLATRIYESEVPRALVDIGTNGEAVLGSKDRLVACSAPAGPAFEGAQIRHGMRGAAGAIERVQIGDDVSCVTIGGSLPIGICGSGLIDVCAKMIDAGVMDSLGRLAKSKRNTLPPAIGRRIVVTPNGVEFVLAWAEGSGKSENIVLTQADIRQLQLAKSAIYSGLVLLQTVTNVTGDKLAELMLCGGFGNYIDIASAVKIKLLPTLPLDRINYVGNAAALGAQMALLSETERNRAAELAQRIEHVALATRPEFQDIFVEGMTFQSATSALTDTAALSAAGA
jgi:uncharacterized 2Fe-2S/4Fe-4S cluster protein (DUF4445 family)